jgi:6-phosphogluconolactonase (cycloisomerase 2 family)
MNLSLKNLLVLLVCSVALVLTGCKKSSSTNYDISVNTTGLVGSGAVVQMNGAYNLPIPSDGTSTFTTQFSSGSPYGLVITKQPSLPPQTCVLANASGTVTGNVSNITMTCSPIEFAYLTNFSGNSIIQLVIDQSTGVLTQNSSPVTTGNAPSAFALDQTGRYAFVVNEADNTIGSYLANSTIGVLVSSGSAVGTGTAYSPAGSPVAVAVDPSSRFVYVANSTTSVISGFNINAKTAALTCVGIAGDVCPSTPTATAGTNPSALAFVTQGGTEYLYAVNFDSDNISEFAVSGSGTLASFASIGTGSGPSAIAATTAVGPFVYVANKTDGTISSYSTSAGTLVSTGTISSGGSGSQQPSSIAINPTGQFLYVVNASGNSIAAFSIGSNGALTSLGSPISTGNQPVSVSVVPTTAQPAGAFVYVANKTDNSVSIYSMNTNGTLVFSATQMMGNSPVSFVAMAK